VFLFGRKIHPIMNLRTTSYLAALAFLAASSGCGNSGRFDATGRLMYKGKPVPSTYVTFQPEEQGKRASHGLTDDDGQFTLTYSRTETGVLPGRHTVFLKYYVSSAEEVHEIPPKASKELRAVIAKYGDPTKSPLHYEVTKNGQVFEINLE
jgi:hypothetical protein